MANPENLIGHGFDQHPERIHRAGRPKGARSRSTIVREALEAILEGGTQQVVDAMTAAVIKRAVTIGDVPAFKELMDSAYGKVADKTLHGEDQENPLTSLKRTIVDPLVK